MDHGHELTEERLKALEARLLDEYTQAAGELQEKLDDYLRRFEKKDKIWQEWVKSGRKTQKEYEQWRMGQLAMGKRWEAMKNTIAEDMLHTNEIARQIIAAEMPEIFGLNANFGLYQIESGGRIDTSLTLYNREAIDRILRDNPEILLPPGKMVSRAIAEGRAVRWEKNKLQSVMIQEILQGESIPKMATRLAEAVADGDYKAAVRNARTMTTNAQNAGRYDAYMRVQKRGVDLTIEWAATLDNRTRHEHRMMHGQRRNIGEPFEVDGIKIMYPAQTGAFMSVSTVPQELIWNCFVGETMVSTDSEIKKSYKHAYSGEIVTVETSSGVNFSCTPNHPILTPSGWVPAALLNKGDNLLVTSRGDGAVFRRNGDINHVHTTMETLHKTLADFWGIVQAPMRNFNFHGDIPTSDVEIVCEERELRNGVNTCGVKGINETLFKYADALCFGKSHFMAGLRRIYIAALSFVRCACKPFSFFWGSVRHPNKHSLGTVANGNVTLTEYPINNLPAETIIRSDLLNGLTGRVFVDNIVCVNKSFTCCHVYNLQTENGYYFVNNSIRHNGEVYNDNMAIAKNCRCTLLAWVKGFEHDTIKYSSKMGDMTFEEWLEAKEQPEPILRQKEKGDAIRASYIREYQRR